MSATGVPLSELPGTEWYFRTCLRDDAQALVLADVVMEKGYSRLATMVLDNTYGIGLETAIVDGLEAAGWQGEHVASIHYDITKLDYRSELGVIRDNKPDVVLAVTYGDDGIIVFKQALEKDGFTVQQGEIGFFNLIQLYNAGLIPSAYGNNPTTKYLAYFVPPAPGIKVNEEASKVAKMLGKVETRLPTGTFALTKLLFL